MSLDALAPLRLPPDLRLSPEQLELVCAENRDAVHELAADGHVVALTPTGSETGSCNGELFFQLKLYAKCSGEWKAFDRSTGFWLPDGSVVSPDAFLIRLERWQALSPEERRSFAHLCADLVVALASPPDDGPRGLTTLRQNMSVYRHNCARLGWLRIPHSQAVACRVVSCPSTAVPRQREQLDVLKATPEFPGLQLAGIWAG